MAAAVEHILTVSPKAAPKVSRLVQVWRERKVLTSSALDTLAMMLGDAPTQPLEVKVPPIESTALAPSPDQGPGPREDPVGGAEADGAPLDPMVGGEEAEEDLVEEQGVHPLLVALKKVEMAAAALAPLQVHHSSRLHGSAFFRVIRCNCLDLLQRLCSDCVCMKITVP